MDNNSGHATSIGQSYSTRWLTNANYLNLRTVTLAYNLPKSILNVINIKSARVNVSAENLFMLKARQGLNPQANYAGVSYNEYMPAKKFTIGLNVSSSIHVGDESSDVDVSLDFGDCDISNVDVINEPSGKWVDKDKPKLEVTLEADDDYYFKSGYAKKNVTLSGDSATVTSIKRKGDEELRIVITLKALKGTSSDYSLDVDEAEWDQMDGVAEWNGSEDAKYYELRVYRDEKFLSTVKETKYNLGRYLTQAGTYTFDVRAVYSDSRHGEWQTSDSFTITAEQAQEIQKTLVFKEAGSGPAAGAWEQDALGYKYRNSDGSYVTNNWQQIGGVWYFFDENAYCKTNTWVFWNEKWYYLDVNGAMLVNTTTPDGKQVGEDGALL